MVNILQQQPMADLLLQNEQNIGRCVQLLQESSLLGWNTRRVCRRAATAALQLWLAWSPGASGGCPHSVWEAEHLVLQLQAWSRHRGSLLRCGLRVLGFWWSCCMQSRQVAGWTPAWLGCKGPQKCWRAQRRIPPAAGLFETTPAVFARISAQNLLPACKQWFRLLRRCAAAAEQQQPKWPRFVAAAEKLLREVQMSQTNPAVRAQYTGGSVGSSWLCMTEELVGLQLDLLRVVTIVIKRGKSSCDSAHLADAAMEHAALTTFAVDASLQPLAAACSILRKRLAKHKQPKSRQNSSSSSISAGRYR
ncbi:hypothetical protein COO60DRAFT_176112 [Scenedesmus sp. NREL 46B-D3]|nr:hypothetical protein COO60DRAFT_176112 [Scenedesmus sp. NREL 46B-D3]